MYGLDGTLLANGDDPLLRLLGLLLGRVNCSHV